MLCRGKARKSQTAAADQSLRHSVPLFVFKPSNKHMYPGPFLHRSLCSFFLLLPPGCEPDIPAGPRLFEVACWSGVLVTEAGTGESRSVWLRRTALAQGLINRPSTLPTLSAQAHTSTPARTLATLSPPSSCNKTSQIWRLREAATARPL